QSLAAGFSTISAGSLAENSAAAVVKSYFSSPRLIVASSQTVLNGASTGLNFALDLRKDDIRAIAYPGQNTQVVNSFNSLWGFSESGVEATVLQQLSSSGVTTSLSTAALFMAAKAQNIPLVSITPATANQLDTAGYSADAKARMSDALQAGKVVIVP